MVKRNDTIHTNAKMAPSWRANAFSCFNDSKKFMQCKITYFLSFITRYARNSNKSLITMRLTRRKTKAG